MRGSGGESRRHTRQLTNRTPGQGRPSGTRPSNVLQLEKIMTDKIGPEASLIHTGRSCVARC